MGYMILHIIWEKTFILLSCMEFVEFHGNRVCLKGHFEGKNFSESKQIFNTAQNGLILAHAQR